MTISEAYSVLGLQRGAPSDAIKKAYRKRAFDTHPDRGGNPTDFLRVQAAFEVLNGFIQANGADEEPIDSLLTERLDDIDVAFEQLYREAESFIDGTLVEFDNATISRINSYRSHAELRNNAQKDVTFLWTTAVEKITNFIELKVNSIADAHDNWLQDYLRPVIDQIRRQNPRRLYERWILAIVSSMLGLVAAGVAFDQGPLWLWAVSAFFLFAGWIFPLMYSRRYASRRIIRGIRMSGAGDNAKLGGLNIFGWVSDEELAHGVGFVASGIGAVFLGPIGAVLGGLLGGLVGWIFGESLASRKEKVYRSVIENVHQQLPAMVSELDRRLIQTKETMTKLIKENFKRNVHCLVNLLKD